MEAIKFPSTGISASSRSLAITAIALLIVTLGLISVHLRLYPYSEDDAYIHFRIASNLANHGYPYFNSGDPVMSSSSPAWTLLLATIFKFVTGDPLAISILNALLTIAGAIVFTRLLQKVTSPSLNPIYVWCFAPLYISLVIYASLGLMETPLALLLLGMGMLLLLDERPFCMFVFGVMAFTRFELGIFMVIAMIFLAGSGWRRLLAGIGWLALGVLPFAAYSLYFGGSLVPNSVAAKQVIYTLLPQEVLGAVVFNFMPHLSLFVWDFNVELLEKGIYFVIVIIVLVTAVLHIELVQRTRDRHKYLVYAIFVGGVIIIAAYVWRHVLQFGWYMPLYAVPIVFAIYRTTICHKRGGFLWLLVLVLLPWFAVILLMLTQVAVAAATNQPSYYKNFLGGARVPKYIQVGRRLYERYPDAILLTSEIGGLGYGFPGYIADGVGIVSPQALAFHPMKVPDERSDGSIGAIPVGYIQTINPGLIVSYDIFTEAFRKSPLIERYVHIDEPFFLQQDLDRMLPGQHWYFGKLSIFIRQDLYEKDPWQ